MIWSVLASVPAGKPSSRPNIIAMNSQDAPFRVLIVEDSVCTSFLYRMRFEKEGFLTEVSVDGEDALRKLAITKFDAVVLDLMLPKIDGMQVLQEMRQSVGQGAGAENLFTPVIIITSVRLGFVQEHAQRYRIKCFLDKAEVDKLVNGLRELKQERDSSVPALRMAAPSELINTSVLKPLIGATTPKPAVASSHPWFRRP